MSTDRRDTKSGSGTRFEATSFLADDDEERDEEGERAAYLQRTETSVFARCSQLGGRGLRYGRVGISFIGRVMLSSWSYRDEQILARP
jgi:hypothetical protein